MGRWKNWSRNIGFVSAKSSIEKHQVGARKTDWKVRVELSYSRFEGTKSSLNANSTGLKIQDIIYTYYEDSAHCINSCEGNKDNSSIRPLKLFQESIRRLPNHVQIVEVGASGVGKTEIIKALFGHNGDLESLKTSSRSSETRYEQS